MPDEITVAAIMALAAFIHAVAGFGSALVSMPVLAWALGLQTAAPVQALLALPLTTQVFLRNRHAFEWREALPLMVASFIGVPVGVWVLASVPEVFVTTLLGVLLIGFAFFELLVAPWREREASSEPVNEGTWFGKSLTGFCSGVLGGAYAANGPPLIMYGVWRRWNRALFRSVLQSVFMLNGVTIVFWHATSGLVTKHVLWFVLFGAPGMVLGMTLGHHFDNRIAPDAFRRFVLALLFVLGISMLAKSGLAH